MIEQVRPADFSAWVNAAAPAQPIVLDVREPWEVQTASVTPDGFTLLHIPMQSLPARVAQLVELHGPDTPIACLCHHGVRSQQVAHFLLQHGFRHVVNLQGGIAAWGEQLDRNIAPY